jgi:membrane-associated protein
VRAKAETNKMRDRGGAVNPATRPAPNHFLRIFLSSFLHYPSSSALSSFTPRLRMVLLHQFIDLFLHLDKHLGEVLLQYGAWVYLMLFLIVFCETGLVVTPILPGDSLLFAAGASASLAGSPLSPWVLIPLLMLAALLGDNVNYFVGTLIGPRVFNRPKSWFFNPAHILRTREFYQRHGGKTVIIARFVPIVRTCAPFVAGIGAMRYRVFILFCLVGAALWVPLFILAGYFFGQQEFVKKNFTLVIFAIIGISLLPPLIEYYRARRRAANSVSA